MKPQTIKELVFQWIGKTEGNVDFETVNREVRRAFPESRWKRSHWDYYRSQIRSPNGRYFRSFGERVRNNLRAQGRSGGRASNPSNSSTKGRGRTARDPDVKKLGDHILRMVRSRLDSETSDPDFRFAVNRWVFARLQLDEIRAKRPIKRALWKSGMTRCNGCGKGFDSLKGLELHRIDPTRGYTIENCELLCRKCHQSKDLGDMA